MLLVPVSQPLADELYDQCIASTGDDKTSRCGHMWIDRADDQLNKVWKKLYGRLDDRVRTKEFLLAEQRYWNGYKGRSCIFYGSDFGTDGEGRYYLPCRARVIEQRTKDLETYDANLQ